MPKYINADEMIIDENEAYLKAQVKLTSKSDSYADYLVNQVVHAKLQRLLADAPAEDVQEVKHAKFELINNGKGVCSNCHRLDSIDKLAKYCRYCGAKLDESATDTNVGSKKE